MSNRVMLHDGKQMAVIRPDNPELALELTRDVMRRQDEKQITGEQAGREFNAIIKAQNYTFVGLLRECGNRLLDPETLEDIGRTLPGDSFVDYAEVKAKMEWESKNG